MFTYLNILLKGKKDRLRLHSNLSFFDKLISNYPDDELFFQDCGIKYLEKYKVLKFLKQSA